jgi:DNA-binding XRE family transcriptional regulator
MPYPPSDFDCERFRAARVKSGKTIEEVALLLGVSRTAAFYWENGWSKPRAANRTACDAFCEEMKC